jgi:hypothetical protein
MIAGEKPSWGKLHLPPRPRHNRGVREDERFEQLIAFLGSQLPAPVEQQDAGDGTLIFIGGAPPAVVVHLDESNVIVSEYAARWTSSVRLTVKPRRIGLLKWRRLPETAMMHALQALIKAAHDMRVARFRRCSVCGANSPPESLFDGDVCETCAEQEYDVVH